MVVGDLCLVLLVFILTYCFGGSAGSEGERHMIGGLVRSLNTLFKDHVADNFSNPLCFSRYRFRVRALSLSFSFSFFFPSVYPFPTLRCSSSPVMPFPLSLPLSPRS